MSKEARKEEAEFEEKLVTAKNAAHLQRIRLDRLMKDPSRPVRIPDKPKEFVPRNPQEFVRHVWGSSAGAGSGDFHVYRGIRRREYAREKFAKQRSKKDELDDKYHAQLEANKQEAENRTAKKRAKRQKQKEKKKKAKMIASKSQKKSQRQCSDPESDSSNDNSEPDDAELTVIPTHSSNTDVGVSVSDRAAGVDEKEDDESKSANLQQNNDATCRSNPTNTTKC